MITVTKDQYIYPPRSADAIPKADTEFLGQMGWQAQLKYNDSRCIVKYCENGTVELWNRHAEKFRSYHCPDHLREELLQLREILGLSSSKVSMLDGGLLDQKHAAIKDTIVIWDILVRDGEHLIGTEYKDRYNTLREKATKPWTFSTSPDHPDWCFGSKFTDNIFIPENYHHRAWDLAWNIVRQINEPYTIGEPNDPNYSIKPLLEGLVFKDPNGELEMAFSPKNNDSWMMRSRVRTGRHAF